MSQSAPTQHARRTLLLYAILAVALLLTLELLVQGLCLASTRVRWALRPANTVPDRQLGYRPNPANPDHDRKGFRNEAVPDSASVVALGDSQTYGTGVLAIEAWPAKLATISSTTVYSMAYGGYGPVHSLMLWEEAERYSPAIVIEAFYAGNDLYDAFDFVYNKGRFPELKSPEDSIRRLVEDAERREPIAERVERMFPDANPSGGIVGLWGAVSERSMLAALANAIATRLAARARGVETAPTRDAWEIALEDAARYPGYCEIFIGGNLRTVFTSEYRLAALNMDDPRVSEGLRISLRAIKLMAEKARARGSRLLVLQIPTKEMVFAETWSEPPAVFRKLIDNERRLWEATRIFLDSNAIGYIDALPALRSQLTSGQQPYRPSRDGHPTAAGHAAIASLVARALAGDAAGGR